MEPLKPYCPWHEPKRAARGGCIHAMCVCVCVWRTRLPAYLAVEQRPPVDVAAEGDGRQEACFDAPPVEGWQRTRRACIEHLDLHSPPMTARVRVGVWVASTTRMQRIIHALARRAFTRTRF